MPANNEFQNNQIYLSILLAGKNYIEGQVIVKFKANTHLSEMQSLQTNFGASLLQSTSQLGAQLWEFNGMTVEEAIDAYGTNPLIEYIQPNFKISLETTIPNDPNFNQLWGLNNTGQTGGTPDADIDASEAWDIQAGNSVVVGVIDTGIDYDHPDLMNNMWTNQEEFNGLPGVDDDGNGYVDDIHGYDFINNDSDPFDDHSHGTHVAGTIAAQGNNGIGVSGVSWSAQLMALKIFDASGSTDSFSAIQAIEYATMMGAKITNNSWGGGGYSQALYDAIAAAGEAGQLFIAAAGNSGSNNDTNPHYPSSYNLDNIIAVAATDHNDQLAGFSSYGATSVDLAAPGASIYSTIPGGGYASYSGTSMATPHVAGVASLIWAQEPTLTAQEVKQRILATVDPIAALQGKTLTGGRLNAYNAVTNTEPAPGQIQGSLWSDLDADGEWDASEPTLQGWTVYLDQNQNNQLDTGETSTLTDANGNYTFLNLTPGTYTVAQLLMPGWQATYPTAFEYQWSDSNQTGGPTFNWIDISSIGTQLSLTDDSFSEVTLPFNFSFYGEQKNTVKISSNGFLTFGSNATTYSNTQFPNSSTPNDIIAPFWDDLNPGAGGSVYYYYEPSQQQFIVQYQGVPRYGSGGSLTFQTILDSDGSILFQYEQLNGTLNSATIGLENADGSDGIQVAYNQNYAANNLAVSFVAMPGSPQPHTVFVGSGATVTGINFGNHLIENEFPQLNLSFETGDFTSWNTLGNSSIQTAAFGSNPTDGTFQALITTGSSAVTDAQLESFLGLNAGAIDGLGNGNATEGSALQLIPLTVQVGDTLTFNWNFLTNEYTPTSYNDFGFVTISNGSLSELADTNNTFSRFAGSFSSQTGYGTFTYQFTQAGTFNIGLGVVDVGDTSVDSGLLLDNFSIIPDPVFNFSFENGDFTNWNVTGNASIQTATVGSNPTEGNYQALITTGSSAVTDAQLESFLGLNAGAIDALSNGNATEGSALQFQPLTVQAGDTLTFDWNFLTNEYTPTSYNDFGFVTISNGSLSELADTNNTFTRFTGSFGSQTGYGTFTYQFTQAGTFNIGLGVVDVGDTSVDSGLLLDNFKIVADPVFNFGFEQGDFTNWNVTGNASIQTASIGSNPTQGTFQALISTASGAVSDAQLETALGLNAGAIDGLGNGNATEGSALQFKPITVQAGDTLSFNWNFLTGEGTPSSFNDFGFVAISNSSLSELADTSSTFIPFSSSFNEQTGYGTFTYQFTQAGTFNVAVGVVDVGDTSVSSGLLVDNFSITPSINFTGGGLVNSNETIPQAGGVLAGYNMLQGTSKSENLVGSDEINDWIYAGAGSDTVIGNLGNDVIHGEDGDDVLRGDANTKSSGDPIGGDDIIYGGNGNDRIGGKGGDDKLYGEAGNDQIWGDDGDDLLWGGRGNDQLWGGKGHDTFALGVGEGTDTIRDFKLTEDLIGLSGQLTFGQLSITQNGKNTLIGFEDETLAILTGVQAGILTEQYFTTV